MKFRLKEDWYFGKNKILEKGSILEPNKDFKYEVEYLDSIMKLSLDDIESNELFEKYEELKIEVKELTQDDEDIVGNWRIQLDVKTSKRKLKEIEKFIRENIKDLL